MAHRKFARVALGLGLVLGSAGVAPAQELPAPVPPLDPPPPLLTPATSTASGPVQVTPSRIVVSQQHRSNSGERQVVRVQATCIEVPKSFCERVGLCLDDNSREQPACCTRTWVLNPREAHMLNLLIKSEPRAICFSRPTLVLTDNQPGFFQVGQKIELVTALEATTKDGTTVLTPRTSAVNAGITLRATPKVASDSKSMMLQIAVSHACLAGGTVSIPVYQPQASTPGGDSRPHSRLAFSTELPIVNSQSVEAMVALPTGGTVVLGGMTSGRQAKSAEVLWILTADVATPARTPPPPAVK